MKSDRIFEKFNSPDFVNFNSFELWEKPEKCPKVGSHLVPIYPEARRKGKFNKN